MLGAAVPVRPQGARALTVASQDRFADAVGFAGESLDALETVQAFGREASAPPTASARAVEAAFAASLRRMTARALMTALVIVLVFGGVSLASSGWASTTVCAASMTPGRAASSSPSCR